jgi:hypothetical protein
VNDLDVTVKRVERRLASAASQVERFTKSHARIATDCGTNVKRITP